MSRLALLALSGCCCLGAPEAETIIDVPGTVEDARARHAPPAVEVTVTRKTRPVGGGGCGHAAVCLVFLPIMAWQAVFPPEIDEIVIAEDGTRVVHGEWEPDGDLIWAERQEGKVLRAARLLDLPALGRRLVVESARTTLDADGKPGEWTPTTVQSQIDLITAYEEALGRRGIQRDQLYVEAMDVIGMEALPLVERHLADPAEDDTVRETVVRRVCGESPVEGEEWERRARVLAAAAKAAGDRSAIPGLACALTLSDRAPAQAFADALVDEICAEASLEHAEALAETATAHPDVTAYTSARVAACAEPTRRTLLRRLTGERPERADLVAAMAGDGTGADVLARWLVPTESADREALFVRLAVTPAAGPVVDRLAAYPELRFTGAEGAVLAAAFLREKSGLLGGRGVQATMLEMLGRLADPAPARAVFGDPEGDALPAIGRLALGDREYAAEALRNVSGPIMVPYDAGNARGLADLAAIQLTRMGCHEDDLYALREQARKLAEGARDGLCTSRK